MAENASKSKVREFYAGKNIFITGGTGFLGLALIEKILRDIPNVGNLYLLMRPKKNKTIHERLEDLTKNPVFDVLLKGSSPEIFKKLVPIHGDVGEEDLGISTDDRNLLIDNINVVIHSAATLDFQQSLKPTVNINLLGTRRVMELCMQAKNLEAMVHVSSAYANSFHLETQEILYDVLGDAEHIIELVKTLDEKQLEELEPKLLKEHPNTYTFTKHFAEHEVNKCADRLPCGIVRPSMITAAWKEPVPGWTNSKNGPQGFFMGASRGVVRRLPLATNLIYDYIPIDVVINQVLVTGQYVNSLKREAAPNTPLQISIFHCTSSSYKPFRWESVKDKVNGMMHRYPLKSAIWYPHLKFVQSLFLFKVSAIFIHFLPGLILDGITKVCGGRPILIRLHTNVWKSLKLLEKFIFTEWNFDNKKTLALAKSMSQVDKEVFGFDIGELKWESYFESMMVGVRQYLSHEHPKTLEAARKKDKVLLFLHVFLQLFIYFLIWWATTALVGSTFSKTGLVVPIAYVLLGLL